MSDHAPLYIFGASGHGKVVAEAVLRAGRFELAGFLDDDATKWGQPYFGVRILGDIEAIGDLPPGCQIALGVGSNAARKAVFERLTARGAAIATVVHPSAVVATGATVGAGSYVGPLAVLHVDATVGRGAIINSAAIVEHDDLIGDWVHVSPNASLGGEVRIGEGTHVGLGACVLPGVSIGSWTTVGAGAVVRASLPDGVTAVGVPARIVKGRVR